MSKGTWTCRAFSRSLANHCAHDLCKQDKSMEAARCNLLNVMHIYSESVWKHFLSSTCCLKAVFVFVTLGLRKYESVVHFSVGTTTTGILF
mmetsp:Transcript_24497/g.31997  ORF Transcript_24497/g.31997 Transcript_24497/m.31997 type:complete len:91 (+) Transcript_24497:1202-1474(+)